MDQQADCSIVGRAPTGCLRAGTASDVYQVVGWKFVAPNVFGGLGEIGRQHLPRSIGSSGTRSNLVDVFSVIGINEV